jgi:hypothetical protein
MLIYGTEKVYNKMSDSINKFRIIPLALLFSFIGIVECGQRFTLILNGRSAKNLYLQNGFQPMTGGYPLEDCTGIFL